jgi:hypothetical protein
MLPPDEPYGSLLVKFRPGVRFSVWMIVWPLAWVEMNSWSIEALALGAVSAVITPSMLGWPEVAVMTTASTSVVPVDCA